VLEQLLSDLQEDSESSFSQNDSIAKSMAKTKTGTLTVKEQENLVNGLLPVKSPNVSISETFHHHACGRFR
jgi:hypothetical protein